MPDTRIFFAAERTLLAWVRTGLTVIALGFVVAKIWPVSSASSPIQLLGRYRRLLTCALAPGDARRYSCAYRLRNNSGCAVQSPGLYILAPGRRYSCLAHFAACIAPVFVCCHGRDSACGVPGICVRPSSERTSAGISPEHARLGLGSCSGTEDARFSEMTPDIFGSRNGI